jgi:hypothetical protein
MVLFFVAVLGLNAWAGEFTPDNVVKQQHLWADFESHMDGLHAHQPAARGMCLTGLVQRLRKDWHVLTVEQRRSITQALAPSKEDLFEPARMLPPPPTPTPVRDTCWESTKDHRIDTEHFSVQWDDGEINEDEAQDFADSLEESWEIEVEELGWKPPSGTDQYLMRVEVERMQGGGGGAYTTVDECGGTYMPYVVASSSSFRQGNWYKTMACHELHHAIQYAYGFAHEFWWWEATSTWVEDLVYPYANDWANALYMFSQSPYLGMNASAGQSNDQDLFWHTYGMGIWGMFLDQKVGGNELVRATWEESEGEWCQYCVWMPDVIEDVGEDFDALFAEFLGTTAVLDYRDRNMISNVKRTATIHSMSPEGEAEGEAPSFGRPQSLGMNIIEFDADLGENDHVLEVRFNGSSSPDYWIAVLARGTLTVDELVVFEIDNSGDGMAYIPFEGDHPVHLVVSPVDEGAQGYAFNWNGDNDFNYSWSARVVTEDQVGVELDEQTTEPTLALGDRAMSDDPKGYGCTTAKARPMGLGLCLIIMGLLAGVRREP